MGDRNLVIFLGIALVVARYWTSWQRSALASLFSSSSSVSDRVSSLYKQNTTSGTQASNWGDIPPAPGVPKLNPKTGFFTGSQGAT
jgi:hypothetical protein